MIVRSKGGCDRGHHMAPATVSERLNSSWSQHALACWYACRPGVDDPCANVSSWVNGLTILWPACAHACMHTSVLARSASCVRTKCRSYEADRGSHGDPAGKKAVARHRKHTAATCVHFCMHLHAHWCGASFFKCMDSCTQVYRHVCIDMCV